jgi:hypothetical protein
VTLEPPSGSRIYVTTVGADSLILIPQGNGGVIEREWLYQLLVKRYALSLTQGKTLGPGGADRG